MSHGSRTDALMACGHVPGAADDMKPGRAVDMKEVSSMYKSSRKLRAFTLVEVLIVVIVLGILAAVVVPQFSSASDDANLSALTTNLQTIRSQIELYRLQHKSVYPTLASFTAQMTAKTDISGGSGTDFGPYLLKIPPNPFTSDSAVTADAFGAGKGWYYNETTGEFRANHDNATHRGL